MSYMVASGRESCQEFSQNLAFQDWWPKQLPRALGFQNPENDIR
jgi:hypothetical protein